MAAGVDLSPVAIESARQEYSNCVFSVDNILNLHCLEKYDCVFIRSCSLYNVVDLETAQAATDVFMSYLKPGGTFIFVYNTKLNKASQAQQGPWRYHSVEEIDRHFARRNARTYFSSRYDTHLLGERAFNMVVSAGNVLASRVLGVGGDIVTFVQKEK